MIRSQGPSDIVSGIWGDQNVRNREDSNHSQRDYRKPHHGTTFIASASGPVKKQGGSLLEVFGRPATRNHKQLFVGVIAGAGGASGDTSAADRAAANGRGKWTECPAFGIGSQYSLTVRNTSDARLTDAYGTKPIKLEYLSSAALPTQAAQPTPVQPHPTATAGEANVHVTSSPSGGEIYVDGKFYGNTPSDINLDIGEHIFKVALGGKEWSRAVQVTGGEINVHAEMAGK
jgi:PEGA domain